MRRVGLRPSSKVHAKENEQANDGTADAPPPIELDTLVACTPDAAFDYFTRDIARWWPRSRYSCSGASAAGVAFEGRQGGKLIETDADGKRYVWGTVSIWEPGKRLALTWHPGKEPDEALAVAITFQEAGAMTRVRLVHSGWERLGPSAAKARESYANGWPTVMGRLFKGYCEQAATDAIQPADSGEAK
jgi:uncharacterized protein YndB with AHSA1/START domain